MAIHHIIWKHVFLYNIDGLVVAVQRPKGSWFEPVRPKASLSKIPSPDMHGEMQRLSNENS